MKLTSLFNIDRWRSFLDQRVVRRDRARIRGWTEHLDRSLVIVDVGCRWGLADIWEALGEHGTVIGFDPDAEECARLQAGYHGPCKVRFVPSALGAAAGTVPLHLTREPACSSVFAPDPVLTTIMPELHCAQLAEKTTIRLTTLDAYAAEEGLPHVDFMKLDTQGYELMVLQGAENCLRSVRALEIEVEFNPIYVDQPLFGDVDRFLRERDFVLWRLKNLAHYGTSRADTDFPVFDHHYYDSRSVRNGAQGGQLLWGHAYYVRRELASFETPSDAQAALRDACLLGLLGFNDISGFCYSHARTALGCAG